MSQAQPSAEISLARPVVVATDASGVTVDIDGKISTIGWSDITLIMGVTVAHGPAHIMMLTFETRDERVLFLSEMDAAWSATTDNLHTYLRNAFAFSEWGQKLVQGAGFTEVWEAEF